MGSMGAREPVSANAWFLGASGPSGPPVDPSLSPQAGPERRLQQLQALQDLSLLLSSTLDLQTPLQALVHELREAFGYARVHVALHRNDHLVPLAATGHGCPLPSLTLWEGVSGFVFRTAEPAFLQDVRESPHYLACNPDTVQEICVPHLEKPFRLEQAVRALHAVLRGEARVPGRRQATDGQETRAGTPG